MQICAYIDIVRSQGVELVAGSRGAEYFSGGRDSSVATVKVIRAIGALYMPLSKVSHLGRCGDITSSRRFACQEIPIPRRGTYTLRCAPISDPFDPKLLPAPPPPPLEPPRDPLLESLPASWRTPDASVAWSRIRMSSARALLGCATDTRNWRTRRVNSIRSSVGTKGRNRGSL